MKGTKIIHNYVIINTSRNYHAINEL